MCQIIDSLSISLDVENAEDDLVQKTEIAIGMMKAVLDNVSGIAIRWLSHVF